MNSNLNNKKDIWLDPDHISFLQCKLVLVTNNQNNNDSKIEEGHLKAIKFQSATTVGRLYGNWYNIYGEMVPKKHEYTSEDDQKLHTKILLQIEVNLFKVAKELTLGTLLSWYNQTLLTDLNNEEFSKLSLPLYISHYYRLKIWATSANFCFPSGHPSDTFDLLNANEINL